MKLTQLMATLWFLQSRSVVNSLRMRARRLQQPKYLIGAVVGLGYFWMIAFRHFFASGFGPAGAGESMSRETQVLVEAGAALVVAAFVVLNWVFTGDRASLRFSEAEVAFLLPAPLSRRSLIHFRLLRVQLGILCSAFFFSLLSGRSLRDGHWFIHLTTWWLVLATLNLHAVAASFTVQQLTERGLAGWRRRLVVLALVGLLVGSVGWWVQAAPSAQELRESDDFRQYALGLLSAGPAPWLLAPFRWLVRPWFARDTLEFLRTVWPAGLLLLAHYGWVMRADVSFEEASIDASRRLAVRLAAARSGGGWQSAHQPKKAKQPPFRLAATGFPPVALLWKNLLGAGQNFTVRFWLMLGYFGVVATFISSMFARNYPGAGLVQTAVAFTLGMLLLLSLWLGPLMLRNDFRSDLPNMDLLKTMPLPGWQIALGQLLAPAAIVIALQWLILLLLLGLSFGFNAGPGAPPAAGETAGDHAGENLAGFIFVWRWPAALAAGLLLPCLDFLLLALPNAATLLFPAWSKSAVGQGGGVEVMGQRLIFVLGQFLVLAVALLPGAGLGLLVWWLAQMALGPVWAVPVAAVFTALVLAAECAAAVWALGLAFARFDMSEER